MGYRPGYEIHRSDDSGFQSDAPQRAWAFPTLRDFLFMPQVGKREFESGAKDKPDEGYRNPSIRTLMKSRRRVTTRSKCSKSGVDVEMTAGERAGMFRFTFPASAESSVMWT